MKANHIALLVVGLGMVLSGTVSAQEGPPVVRVVTVDTHGNTAEYIKLVKPVLERVKELSPEAEYRIYEGLFAGESTRRVYVAISYPTLIRLAASNAKVEADAEYQRRVAALAATQRTIVSDSILIDRTQ